MYKDAARETGARMIGVKLDDHTLYKLAKAFSPMHPAARTFSPTR